MKTKKQAIRRWIDIYERLPKPWVEVWVQNKDGVEAKAQLDDTAAWRTANGLFAIYGVIYWSHIAKPRSPRKPSRRRSIIIWVPLSVQKPERYKVVIVHTGLRMGIACLDSNDNWYFKSTYITHIKYWAEMPKL